MACKDTNLARKGNYSSTLTGCLRARALFSSNHYSLVRPDKNVYLVQLVEFEFKKVYLFLKELSRTNKELTILKTPSNFKIPK